MKNLNFKTLKAACYTTSATMSIVCNISPLLFLTFRTLYGISYSYLGLLVLINFSTQLTVDLLFSFFSHKFNIPAAVKITPVLGAAGLIVYALAPVIFPSAIYVGLLIGTVIFSASSGLAEVLISPVIAAIPAKDPDREMSKLHSIYAWGVVGIIITGTVFLYIFGGDHWQWLPISFSLIPTISSILFLRCEIPQMKTPEKVSGTLTFLKNPILWICVIAIFLGGAAECTMAQWCSGYVEKALGIKKIWGDLFGTAMFGLALALGRSMYAKIGRNISKWLLYGGIGATLCYIIAALSPIPIAALIACAATGFFVAMMWPGILVVAEKFIPMGGVFIFAMMASGGDLGASVGPQLVGLVTDFIIATPSAATLSSAIGITSEQLGMKLGLLIGALFPLVAIIFYSKIRKMYKKDASDKSTK